MNRYRMIAMTMIAVFLVSCGKYDNQKSESNPAPTGTQGNSPIGTWYEQSENAARLEISKRTITYYSGNSDYTDKTAYSLKQEKDFLRLETEEEFFVYEDMYYDAQQDMLICYTMSHMDGDGGHHRVEFCRNEYVAPPAPTYDPPVDLSDPNAPKEFADLTIRSMEVSFYDEGMPYDASSNMAMEPPYADDYFYSLNILEDGTGLVSSSYCQEIDISKETVDILQQYVKENDLGQINGIDIHTEGLPYGSPDYTVEIELMSGETIYSSANGEDVPEIWRVFQGQMHHLLFDAFVNAGYNYGTGEFHSTKPMKRIGGESTLRGGGNRYFRGS